MQKQVKTLHEFQYFSSFLFALSNGLSVKVQKFQITPSQSPSNVSQSCQSTPSQVARKFCCLLAPNARRLGGRAGVSKGQDGN